MLKMIPLICMLAAPPNTIGPMPRQSNVLLADSGANLLDLAPRARLAKDPFSLPSRRAQRMPSDVLPMDLASLWPKGVDVIEGLRFYPLAHHSQKLTVINNRSHDEWYPTNKDDFVTDGPVRGTRVNPNRVFPYAVSGGLHNSTGWLSTKAAKIPGTVHIWSEGVPVPGTSTPLPKARWAFPSGTVFVDMLSKDGKCFELRTATKDDEGKWKREFIFRDMEAAPSNFHGAGRSCVSCHKDAGATQQYGVSVRGDDGVFTWTPFEDGTFTRRPDVDFQSGKPGIKAAVAQQAPVMSMVSTAAPSAAVCTQ